MISTVLQTLSTSYFDVLMGMTGIEISILRKAPFQGSQYQTENNMTALMDFTGMVNGYFSVSASEEDVSAFAGIDRLPDVEFRASVREEYEDLMSEALNGVSGDCLELLRQKYVAISGLVPKVIFGTIHFSAVPFYGIRVETTAGVFEFAVSVDQMQMEVSRFIEGSIQKEKQLKALVRRLEGSLEQGKLFSQKREEAIRKIGNTLEIPVEAMRFLLNRLSKIHGNDENQEILKELQERTKELMNLSSMFHKVDTFE